MPQERTMTDRVHPPRSTTPTATPTTSANAPRANATTPPSSVWAAAATSSIACPKRNPLPTLASGGLNLTQPPGKAKHAQNRLPTRAIHLANR